MPPVCTGAVVVTGSDCSLAGEWPALRARTRCRRTGFLVGPLGGALDPLVGRCWAMVPLDLHLCLIKPTPRASRTVRHVYRRPCILGSGGVRSRRRPGPLVRSRHKLRDGRPAAQSRPVQWSQAAEACSGVSSLLLFWEPKTSVLEPNRTFWNQIVRFGTITFSVRTLLQLGIFFGCNVYKCVQMCLLEVTSLHRR
jgi:hypothetical protein